VLFANEGATARRAIAVDFVCEPDSACIGPPASRDLLHDAK